MTTIEECVQNYITIYQNRICIRDNFISDDVVNDFILGNMTTIHKRKAISISTQTIPLYLELDKIKKIFEKYNNIDKYIDDIFRIYDNIHTLKKPIVLTLLGIPNKEFCNTWKKIIMTDSGKLEFIDMIRSHFRLYIEAKADPFDMIKSCISRTISGGNASALGDIFHKKIVEKCIKDKLKLYNNIEINSGCNSTKNNRDIDIRIVRIDKPCIIDIEITLTGKGNNESRDKKVRLKEEPNNKMIMIVASTTMKCKIDLNNDNIYVIEINKNPFWTKQLIEYIESSLDL
jgi:hypothetical protein